MNNPTFNRRDVNRLALAALGGLVNTHAVTSQVGRYCPPAPADQVASPKGEACESTPCLGTPKIASRSRASLTSRSHVRPFRRAAVARSASVTPPALV